MSTNLRGTLLGLLIACTWLGAASVAQANAPRIAPGQARPATVALGGLVNVKLTPAAAAGLRAESRRGLARMRSVSPEADRLVATLNARSMEPVLRTELIFPAAIDWGLDRWYSLAVDPAADVNVLVARARGIAGVEYAEPGIVSAQLETAPNDSMFSKNWGHGNTGTFPSFNLGTLAHDGANVGTVGFDSNVQTGWGSPAGYGSTSTIVAIFDTGVDPGHPDLRQVQGYDYWNSDSIPNDGNGHGTACAGIAAGIADNTRGVAGAAGGCTVMGIRFFNDAANNVNLAGLTSGLAYAISRGARIASMSFSLGAWSKQVSDALNAADQAGMVMFAATGNENAAAIAFPARHPKVIAVGAASPCGSRKRSSSDPALVNPGNNTDSLGVSCDNETWWGSNWGVATMDDSAAVDIIGPTMLPTTDVQGAGGFSPSGYDDWFNGTSCATPYVAGVAALLLSQHPTWTPAQVRQRLVETTLDIADAQTPVGWDKYTGYGMVNAGLPDLVPYQFPGWAKSVVPRPAPDGTFSSVPAPTVLTGDGTTYINAGIGNLGDAASGLEDWRVVLDGAQSLFTNFNLPQGNGAYANNAPTTVPGGRHTYGHIVDFDNTVVETNETNNRDAHQWVWQPATLALNAIAARATPPVPTGGTSDIPVGETFYSNQDAVRASSPPGGTVGFWVVGARGTDLGDLDLYIYRPSTGATNGFVPTSSLAFSAGGGATTEFAWWNLGSASPKPSSLDAGIIRAPIFASPASVRVENRASTTGVAFTGATVSIASQSVVLDQALAVHYLDVQVAGAGPVTIEMTTSATGSLGAGLHVALISSADSAGARNNALQFSGTVNGVERLSRNLPTGLYGLVVYRDVLWEGMGSATYTLTIRRTPAELVAGGVGGWYAPSVPYKSGVGSVTSAPTVLDGNVNSTIFGYSYTNTGPTTASGFVANEYIDGQLVLSWTPGALPAGAGAAWGSSPRNVRGGLHTMGFTNDATNVIAEFNEGNNNHASQWVWSPLPLTDGVPVTRPGLPDPTGGWNEIPVGVPRYANVDGLRSPPFFAATGSLGHRWGAVAIAPTDAVTNPDLQVSDTLSTGPSNGFRSPDEISARPGDATDLVVVDNYELGITLDVGLYKSAGNAPVKVHAVKSIFIFPSGGATDIYGPFSLGPDSLIMMIERITGSGFNGSISLRNLSGGANLDFMVFGHTDPTRLYNPGQAAVTAAAHGSGSDEFYSGPLPGDPVMVVLKAGSADVAKKATFQIVFGNGTTGVGDDLPTRIAFAPITPNPANADAAMRFDLPREMPVDLAAYDVGGRRVSTLANGTWNAGRHTMRWSLRGDGGEPLPSGVYLVRFVAGGFHATQRVLVVR
jgi:subtilisin family serine protease